MPMDFSTIESVKRAASVHGALPKSDTETDDQFRNRVFLHVKLIDRVEAFEILFGVPWDKWDEVQKAKSLNL